MKRELYRSIWEKEFFEAQKRNDGSEKKLIGLSPGGAAAELSVSRQRIHQLVNEMKLDQITILDKNGRLCAVYISDESIRQYKLTDRRPGRKPKEILKKVFNKK